jgi:hypothetical protein
LWDTLGTISHAGEPKRLDGSDIAVSPILSDRS